MVTKKYASLTQIQSLISQGKTSCSDLAKYYLNRNKENKHLNAMLEVFEEEVLNRAAIIDEKIKAGTSGKLAGMFLAIKDNILFKSLNNFKNNEIYNIADDKPAPQKEVAAYGAKLLKLEEPKLVKLEKVGSEMLQNFYKDSKKVDNKKMKSFFNYDLKYPTYEEGLNYIFNNGI